MPKFYVKISGAAMGIEAATPEEAIAIVKTHADVYCGFYPLEVGKDVDELGWPMPPKEAEAIG